MLLVTLRVCLHSCYQPPLLRFSTSQVKWVDPDTKEEIDTGLVRVKSQNQTAGGGSVDVGGGNEFGGAGEDEGADDHEETKLDQFWVSFHSPFIIHHSLSNFCFVPVLNSMLKRIPSFYYSPICRTFHRLR